MPFSRVLVWKRICYRSSNSLRGCSSALQPLHYWDSKKLLYFPSKSILIIWHQQKYSFCCHVSFLLCKEKCIHWFIIIWKSRNSHIQCHHHHHVVPLARISLTLSRHFSLSIIASGRSSRLHPISSHSCWMYVHAGHPAFARPYVGVHRSTSLMSSSLLLQQCPACLVRLTWIVFMMGGRWLYSWCVVGCCHQDLFKIARSILV